MTFEKRDWINYGKKARYIAIGVKDSLKQTIESFELEKGKDRDNFRKIKKINNYGFKIKIEDDKELEKESDWIKKDMKW